MPLGETMQIYEWVHASTGKMIVLFSHSSLDMTGC